MSVLIGRRRIGGKDDQRGGQREQQHDDGDHDIGRRDRLHLGAVKGVARGGVHRRQRGLVMFDARQDEIASDQNAGQRAERIGRLRPVQPPRRARRIAKLAHQRIGRCLQKGQPRRDHEQAEQEQLIDPGRRRRIEEQRAGAIEQQPQHDRRLVAITPHHHRGGHREQEIAEIEDLLDKAGLEIAEREGLAKLRDQDVVQVVGHAPQEEQADRDDERGEIAAGNADGPGGGSPDAGAAERHIGVHGHQDLPPPRSNAVPAAMRRSFSMKTIFYEREDKGRCRKLASAIG